MLMKFKKFQNKFFVHMKTFDVTIDHILVHFIGSKVGLYVSFLICLYVPLSSLGDPFQRQGISWEKNIDFLGGNKNKIISF